MLASAGLPLEAKGRLDCACVCSAMLYGNETLTISVIEEDVTRLESKDARTVRWIRNVRPDRISAKELRIRLKLKGMTGCVQDRKLQWLYHLEKMEECACSGSCRTFKVSSSFPRGQPRKTCDGVIRNLLKERTSATT